MFTLIVTEKGGSPKRLEFDKDEITIGRVPGNDVILPKGNVSKRHSRVVRQDGRFFVVDLKSTNGTYLNGRRITTPSVIRPGDKIYVGDFVVVVDMGEGSAAERGAAVPDEVENGAGAAMEAAGGRNSPSMPIEGSIVEPLPLDQEPSESAPPPPTSGSHGRPGGSLNVPIPPLGGPPRTGMMTQPLGTAAAAAIAPNAVVPPAAPPIPGGQNSATQPPPRSSTGGGLRASLGAASPTSGPAPSAPNAAMRGTLGGTGPVRLPVSGSGGLPSRAPVREAAGATPTSVPTAPAHGEPPRRPSSAGMSAIAPPVVSQRVVEAEPLEDEDEEQDDGAVTGAPPPPTTAIPPLNSQALAAPPTPAATLSIAPAVVDALIKSHRAASAGVEPTPPGREYADVLAEIVAEARSNGASAPAERLADTATRTRVRGVVESLVRRRDKLPAGATLERLVRDATAEIAGAGAIESALEEVEVTTVIVEANGRVLVGRGDALGPSPFWFSSDAAVVTAVDRLLHANGASRAVDQPVTEASLADGTRLLAVLPPVAGSGPTVVIERAAPRATTLAELPAREMLTEDAATLLGQALLARRNVFVTGPRGSGRSTLLGALLAAVSTADRCVLVEARRELARAFPGLTALEARGDWAAAVRLALRLRPQRLVLGDVDQAGGDALVALMATGAEGCLAVAEGPTPALALSRLGGVAGAARDEALARLAATRPLVVHCARLGDGTCRVVSIGEVRAGAQGALALDEAFALRVTGANEGGRLVAQLVPTGVVPTFGASG